MKNLMKEIEAAVKALKTIGIGMEEVRLRSLKDANSRFAIKMNEEYGVRKLTLFWYPEEDNEDASVTYEIDTPEKLKAASYHIDNNIRLHDKKLDKLSNDCSNWLTEIVELEGEVPWEEVLDKLLRSGAKITDEDYRILGIDKHKKRGVVKGSRVGI